MSQQDYMSKTGSRVVQNLSGTALQHVEPGDFISHLRTFQGGLELSRLRGKVSPAYTVVTPRAGADPRFFRHVLKSAGYISQIASVTDQLRDGQSMRFAEFNQTWLPLPPIEEQRRIADYLDHETAEIDAFNADLESMRNLSIERWRRFRDDVLTGGEAALGNPRLWLGRTDPTWRIGALKNMFSVTLGKMLDEKKQAVGDPAPYLRAANLRDGELRIDDLYSMPFDARERAKYDLKRRDVLVIEGGATVGTNVVLEKDLPGIFFQKTINRLRPIADASSVFYAEVLNAYRESGFIAVVGNGSTIPHLPAEKLEALVVPVPSLQEQYRLAAQLQSGRAAIDETVADIDAAIALAKERRAALITAAVTGQIDVAERQKPVIDRIQTAIEEAR